MAVLTYNGNIIGKSSANDGVLTIKRNNVTLDTFSANSASNKTVNIEVPTTAADVGAMPISGGSFTGNVTWTSTALPQFSNHDIPFFLGIEAFADGGQTKWLAKADVKNALDVPTKLSDLTDDVVSGNYVKLSASGAQTITNTLASQLAALLIKNSHTLGMVLFGFKDANDTILGYLGVNASKKPIFYDTSLGEKALAFKNDTASAICRYSSTSFRDAAKNTDTTSIPYMLDTGFSISSQATGMSYINLGNGGPVYNCMLFKHSNDYWSIIPMGYANAATFEKYTYSNGTRYFTVMGAPIVSA